MTKTYSQEEMDNMKMELDVNYRLTNIERTCDDISDAVLKHVAIEKKDFSDLMAALEQSATERRKCEADLRTTISENSKVYYNTFVKKSDLKLYASLIMITVVAATGFQAYLSRQHVPSVDLLERIERAIK